MQKTLKRILALLLSLVLIPTLTWAQAGSVPSFDKFDSSFNVGPVAVSVQMTTPIQAQASVVWNTLHIEARDDTQTPRVHASLDAVGQAADAATLLGGFLPAAIIVQKDLAAGLTLAQAEADAQTKTGVTITSFHDDLIEYALVVVLIAFAATVGMEVVAPSVNPQVSAVQAKMQASLAAMGGSDLTTLVSGIQTSLTTVAGGSTIP